MLELQVMILDLQPLYQFFSDLQFLFSFLVPFKWIIFPVLAFIIFLIFKDALLFYSQSKFKKEIEWDMFELRIPREIEKGPKAMEQFFNGLWTLRNTPTALKEKYIDGEVTRWLSFEIFGSGGKVGLYVRVPKKIRHAAESMLYAQYPDIEIIDTVDYTEEFPDSLEALNRTGYDLGGTELKFGKEDPYPINTYQAFEEKGGEERIIDPISVILELLSKLRPEEKIWIQVIVRPSDPEWVKRGEKVIEEMKEKIAPPRKAAKPGQPPEPFVVRPMAPGEEENLKIVGRKISKPGFDTLIRYIYLAPKDIFNRDLIRQLGTYFGQYSSNLNFIFPNLKTTTRATWYKWPFLFARKRTETRKRKLLYKYKNRYIPEEAFIGRLTDKNRADLGKRSSVMILNSEELATLFHPPTNVVLTAPTLERIESKRISPPGYIPF